MNEIIERVAIALWALETETDCHDWDELAQFKKDETYEKAIAAVKAMHEPSEAMLANAGSVWITDPETTSFNVWQAMIDAALK